MRGMRLLVGFILMLVGVLALLGVLGVIDPGNLVDADLGEVLAQVGAGVICIAALIIPLAAGMIVGRNARERGVPPPWWLDRDKK